MSQSVIMDDGTQHACSTQPTETHKTPCALRRTKTATECSIANPQASSSSHGQHLWSSLCLRPLLQHLRKQVKHHVVNVAAGMQEGPDSLSHGQPWGRSHSSNQCVPAPGAWPHCCKPLVACFQTHRLLVGGFTMHLPTSEAND